MLKTSLVEVGANYDKKTLPVVMGVLTQELVPNCRGRCLVPGLFILNYYKQNGSLIKLTSD